VSRRNAVGPFENISAHNGYSQLTARVSPAEQLPSVGGAAAAQRSYNRDPRKLVASTPGHYDPLEGGESMRHTYTLTQLPEDTKGKFMEVRAPIE